MSPKSQVQALTLNSRPKPCRSWRWASQRIKSMEKKRSNKIHNYLAASPVTAGESIKDSNPRKSPEKPRSDRFLENKQTQQQNQGIQSRNQIAQQLLRSHSRLISLALKPRIFYQNSKSISKQQTHSLASSQPNNASRLTDLSCCK
jgi:hypothetical protein